MSRDRSYTSLEIRGRRLSRPRHCRKGVAVRAKDCIITMAVEMNAGVI